MEVLMWVPHAERPLHVDGLCHALGVEGTIGLNIRNVPAVETLLPFCLGLVTVEKSSFTIRFVHYSLQEYLSHYSDLFLMRNSIIAKVCRAYLNFRHIRVLSPTLRSVPPTAPFVEYASCYWGIHSRRGNTESVKTLALKLLDGYHKHVSSKILLLRGIPPGASPLIGKAILGDLQGFTAPQTSDAWREQLLYWRRINGMCRQPISMAKLQLLGLLGVKVLPEQSKVNPDRADTEYGRTPLSWAAENGHEGAVNVMLELNNVNPDRADKWGRTPLSYTQNPVGG